MKRWYNSIFFRMFLIFIVLFIPIYIMMFTSLYSKSVELTRKEIVQLAQYQTDNFLKELEDEIQRMQSLLYHITLNDQNIQMLVSIPEINGEFGKVIAINNVKELLKTISYSSSYINDVRIHFPTLGRTISVNNDYKIINKNEYRNVLEADQKSTSILRYINNRILLVASDVIEIEGCPRFIIVIELSDIHIKDNLKRLDYQHNSWTVLESQELGLIIATNEKLTTCDTSNIANTSNLSSTVVINGERFLQIKRTNKYLGISVIRYLPYNELFDSLNRLKKWVWISILGSLCIVAIYGLATYNIITKPINRLVLLLKQVEQGNYESYLDYDTKDEFNYIYQQFNAMVEKISYLIDQVYKREIYVQKAELKQLQAQINPHFLYNSFFSMSVMVENGQYDLLKKFTHNLGEYFRFITKDVDRDIELSEEVRHARVYAEIQSMRFSNRVKVIFEPIPEKYKYILVPRLIIQPIVENAFIHGFKNKLDQGILHVTYEALEDSLIISISDNSGIITEQDIEKLYVNLYAEESHGDITGLINVNRRIRLKFGKTSGIYPFRNKYGGLTINMKLDFGNKMES